MGYVMSEAKRNECTLDPLVLHILYGDIHEMPLNLLRGEVMTEHIVNVEDQE
jgi:hypothetical protein